MTLEISPYFTEFSKLLAVISQDNSANLRSDVIKKCEEILISMELEARSDDFLKGQLPNVHFYRSLIWRMFYDRDSRIDVMEITLSLYREKVQLQTFYMDMKMMVLK
jgi:hypothetical protein